MTIRLSSCLRAFCLITIVAILLSGQDQDLFGAWYAIGFLSVIYVFTSEAAIKRQPFNLLLSAALIFYYGLRLWDYYVFGPTAISSFFSVDEALRSSGASRAMAFAMMATLLMYLGLFAGTLPLKNATAQRLLEFQPYCSEINKDTFFKIYLVLLTLELVFNYSTYMNFTGRGVSVFLKMFSYLDNHEILLAVAAMIFARSRGTARVQWYVMIAFVLLNRTVGGARSGLLDIVEILFAWAIIPGNWSGTFKISVKTAVGGLIVAIGSVFMFLLVTMVRISYVDPSASINLLGGNVTVQDSWDLLLVIYHPISYRIGTNLDTLIYVFSSNYDTVYANLHVNLYTAIQTCMQVVFHIPANPRFDFSEYEFGHIIGNPGRYMNGQVVLTGYSWGIFAYAYQIFAGWALPVIFGTFYLFGRSYAVLRQRTPSLTRDVLMFASAHAMELLLTLFGLANMLARYQRMAVTYVVVALVLQWFSRAKVGGPSGESQQQPSSPLSSELPIGSIIEDRRLGA